jgi:hypothetical protein
MTQDQAHLKNKSRDADEAWIAKYRAALNENPVRPSRSMRIRAGLQSLQNATISKIGKVLARWTGVRRQSQKPAISSVALPPAQAPTSISNRALSAPKADELASPVITGKAPGAEHSEAWQEKPVA